MSEAPFAEPACVPAKRATSHLAMAVSVFLSPVVWALPLIAVVHSASTPGGASFLAGFVSVFTAALLLALVPIAIGLWARSRTGLGFALAACVGMVLTGLALLDTVSGHPLVGLACVHLVAAGMVAPFLLLSRGTRAEFTTTDAARDDAMWGAIEAETAAEGHPVMRWDAEPLPGDLVPAASPPVPVAALGLPRLSWSDFSPAARVLLVCAAVLAGIGGWKVRLVGTGMGFAKIPTAASYAFLLAALACGITAGFMARATNRRRHLTAGDQ